MNAGALLNRTHAKLRARIVQHRRSMQRCEHLLSGATGGAPDSKQFTSEDLRT